MLAAFSALAGLAALTAWNVTDSDALTRSRQAYARGDVTASLKQALEHLDRRPWSRDAALMAARCLSRLDYADAAEPYYQKAGTLGLDDLQVRAFALVRGNHRQRAIEAYEQILARWPDNVTALRRLAAVQLTENNVPQLNGLAERLIQTPGGAAIGYTLRGAVANQEQNHEGVVAAYTKVLENDPDLQLMPLPRPLFWSQFAEGLIKSGKLEEACQYLTKVLDRSPDAALMNTLGEAYLLRGQLDEAGRSFRQAAEWDPRAYTPHANLGKVELQRRRPELALKHYQDARARAPRRDDLLFSMSSVYRLLDRPAEADRLQRLIAEHRARPARPTRDPKDPWPRHAL